MSKFHNRLQELRKEKFFTQERLAINLNIKGGKQVVSSYENGQEPSYDVLIKIADYFDVSVDYLLGRADQRHPKNVTIYKETGLREEAVKSLTKLKENEEIINAFISNDKFERFIWEMHRYVWDVKEEYIDYLQNKIKSTNKKEFRDELYTLQQDPVGEPYLHYMELFLKKIIDEMRFNFEPLRMEKLKLLTNQVLSDFVVRKER